MGEGEKSEGHDSSLPSAFLNLIQIFIRVLRLILSVTNHCHRSESNYGTSLVGTKETLIGQVITVTDQVVDDRQNQRFSHASVRRKVRRTSSRGKLRAPPEDLENRTAHSDF